MRTLLVMRHAKSSWDNPRLDDHDRPLNPRGCRDAPRMGQFLRGQGLIPDRIVSSTAVRARTTAEFVAKACDLESRLTVTEDLYHAPADEWCRQVQSLDDSDQTVLCIGHNPGLEDFLANTTGQYVAMPTSAIAHLQYNAPHWSALTGNNDATLVTVWRPKELPS